MNNKRIKKFFETIEADEQAASLGLKILAEIVVGQACEIFFDAYKYDSPRS